MCFVSFLKNFTPSPTPPPLRGLRDYILYMILSKVKRIKELKETHSSNKKHFDTDRRERERRDLKRKRKPTEPPLSGDNGVRLRSDQLSCWSTKERELSC